jgi:hypothetical protein
VWFKAGAAGTRQEPGLLVLLADRVPALVPELLAVDTERGWSLTHDGGPILRQVLAPAESWEAWEGVLRRYADAQTRLADDRDDVLATGVREGSAATVPRQARALLEDLAARPVAEGGLTAAEAARLAAVLPRLDSWCAELAASPVPDSVQHDDLHSANVCWTGSVATARIIDWGDAVWGFPLTTMLGTMNSVAFHAGLYADGQPVLAPEVLRVRDAYLEPFTAQHRAPTSSGRSSWPGGPAAWARRWPTARRWTGSRSPPTPVSASRPGRGCWRCSTTHPARPGARGCWA